jgi:pimeloyl-ACP methyl ester carboxylesterase
MPITVAGPQPITIAGLPAIHSPASGSRKNRLTVLFAHGVMCDHTFFDSWVSWFSRAGFDAYAVSRRGRQGQPPVDSRGVTFADFLDDTCIAAQQLPRPLLLVGHSLGGILALKAAELGACDALALLAPVPPRGVLPLVGLRHLPPQLAQLTTVLMGGTFNPSFRQASAMFMGRIPAAQRRDLYRRYTPDSGLALRSTYLPGISVDPARLTIPLICLVGAEDATIPPRIVAKVAKRYGGECRTLLGHAHELVAEPGWEDVAAIIGAWAERILPTIGRERDQGGTTGVIAQGADSQGSAIQFPRSTRRGVRVV